MSALYINHSESVVYGIFPIDGITHILQHLWDMSDITRMQTRISICFGFSYKCNASVDMKLQIHINGCGKSYDTHKIERKEVKCYITNYIIDFIYNIFYSVLCKRISPLSVSNLKT